jgi:hypothetical protein
MANTITKAGGTLKNGSIKYFLTLLLGATEVLNESMGRLMAGKHKNGNQYLKHRSNSSSSRKISNINNSKVDNKRLDTNAINHRDLLKPNYLGLWRRTKIAKKKRKMMI